MEFSVIRRRSEYMGYECSDMALDESSSHRKNRHRIYRRIVMFSERSKNADPLDFKDDADDSIFDDFDMEEEYELFKEGFYNNDDDDDLDDDDLDDDDLDDDEFINEDENISYVEFKRKRSSQIVFGDDFFWIGDVRHSWDEVESKVLENESFCGKHVDSEKVQQFLRLSKAANEFDESSKPWLINMDISKPERTSKHADVMLSVKEVALIKEPDVKRINKLLEHSDSLSLITPCESDGTLNLVFMVSNVWE